MKQFVLLMLIVALGVSAFGEGRQEAGAADPAEQVSVTWTAHPAYSLSGSDAARVAYLKKALEDWQTAHPAVTVVQNTLSTNNNEAMAKLLEQASQGRAPDVAQIDSFIFPRYIPYLMPLDDLLASRGLTPEDFFPFARDVVKGPDGKIYGIQFTTDARVLYYRKDLVKTPPATWDDVRKLGMELKASGYDALLIPAGRGEGAVNTSLYPMFWGLGGELVDAAGKPVFGTGANRDRLVKVLSFYRQLTADGLTPARCATYGNESDLNTEVVGGKAAMFLGGNWQVNQLRSALGEAEFSRWAVAKIPQASGAKSRTSVGGWAWGVFAKTPAVREAAFDLVANLYINDAGMSGWTSVAGYLPTRKSVYADSRYKKNEFSDQFKAILESDGKMRPPADVYQRISTELQVALSGVVSGTVTPEAAVDAAWAAVSR